MVAVITSGEYIRGAVSYNEIKVSKGKAECIAAINYPKDHTSLGFTEKVKRLTNLADLRENIEHKCVHISLNFHPSERMAHDKMVEIAESYMEKLGFGEQPFLIYHHKDTAQSHIHIVTTSIREDATAIRLHNLVKEKSEPARKAVEIEFDLVRAQGRDSNTLGILGTKSDISNTVRVVFKQYKYTSFTEYATILEQFGIIADRGEENSMMYKKGGLQYLKRNSIDGTLSKPIKASAIFDKPTLKKIEEKYENNDKLRTKYKARLCRVIDDLLSSNPTLESFQNQLREYKINVLLRKNELDQIYGITYIDNLSLCIFNGRDLDKKYAAKRILSHFADNIDKEAFPNMPLLSYKFEGNKKTKLAPKASDIIESFESLTAEKASEHFKSILEDLLEPGQTTDYISSELLKEAKKKAKRKRR